MSDTILWQDDINWQWNYVRYSIVEVLHYQPEGRGFDFRWGLWVFFIELILRDVSVSNINYYSTRGISWEIKVAGG